MNLLELLQEIIKLREDITIANYRYYILADPTLPDGVWDKLFQRLKDKEQQFAHEWATLSPTAGVGYRPLDLGGFRHNKEYLIEMLALLEANDNEVSST